MTEGQHTFSRGTCGANLKKRFDPTLGAGGRGNALSQEGGEGQAEEGREIFIELMTSDRKSSK